MSDNRLENETEIEETSRLQEFFDRWEAVKKHWDNNKWETISTLNMLAYLFCITNNLSAQIAEDDDFEVTIHENDAPANNTLKNRRYSGDSTTEQLLESSHQNIYDKLWSQGEPSQQDKPSQDENSSKGIASSGYFWSGMSGGTLMTTGAITAGVGAGLAGAGVTAGIMHPLSLGLMITGAGLFGIGAVVMLASLVVAAISKIVDKVKEYTNEDIEQPSSNELVYSGL